MRFSDIDQHKHSLNKSWDIFFCTPYEPIKIINQTEYGKGLIARINRPTNDKTKIPPPSHQIKDFIVDWSVEAATILRIPSNLILKLSHIFGT